MAIKSFLEDLILKKAPGPSPSFTVFDIIESFELIGETGSAGRGKLSDKLGLGEGATRTMITRLAEAGAIFASKSGCSFTTKGKRIWNDLKVVLPRKANIEPNELTFADHNVAVLVKGKASVVNKGLEQRDAAVKAGAKGATTLVSRGNRILLPTISEDVAADYPKAFSLITQLMKPEDGDAVIISSADGLKEAERGALAAAWTLV
jgi:hypothetical protein